MQLRDAELSPLHSINRRVKYYHSALQPTLLFLCIVLSNIPLPCHAYTTACDKQTKNISIEQLLLRSLMHGYDKSVRPVYNSSKAVVVGLGLTLTQILDVDEKNQVLTTNVWLETEWEDEKLSWDPEEYGLNNTRIPCQMIWLPDVLLYNSADDYTSGYMPSLAMVYSSGRVFWGPVVRFRSSCRIDITYFPFDDQVCRLKLGSWAYNGLQVDVMNRSNTIDLTNFVDNGEWELVSVKVRRNVVYYACCTEPFPDVTFYVHLRRRIKYYMMNLIIPCIILSILCLAGFLLPPESGEKVTLGLSVLLTLTVFMLMVADKMPQTSESISIIGIYLLVVLSTSCLSVISAVFVLGIHHQRGRPQRVPCWLRKLVCNILAPALCLKLSTNPNQKSTAVQMRKPDYRDNKKIVRKRRIATEEMDIIRLERKTNDPLLSSTSMNPTADELVNCLERKSNHERLGELRELILLLQRKHSEEVVESDIYREWRDVAFVLDRLMFVLYLLITSLSTLFLLTMRPPDVSL
ncbi:neuronal acetylcholine receptor subunit alpha-10-like [Octopus vulgaris]|uniref:Neuronal acetylcholine receptor subunit alpha-10-like n=1 Tax=Octopus vulgaris TaxID=6645 RepID=A0AA36BY65_OCTVU|nr:neuronal acetylcholine receptor subunit alpha-10-like [Octopus vulgaris]